MIVGTHGSEIVEVPTGTASCAVAPASHATNRQPSG